MLVGGPDIDSDVVEPEAPQSAGSVPRASSSALSCDVEATERRPDLVDADRGERARAHEAAAGTLAARGEWERAYRHLEAAVSLERPRTAVESRPEPLHHEVDRLRRERAEAREQSRRDALTAGYNRRYLDERLATLRGNSRGVGCLALADVDHFKEINDSYGHGHGDEVLRRLAALMSADLPDGAFCARYGGEEFALVMPDLDPLAAVDVAEAARARVDGHCWDDVVPGLRVTASFGVTCLETAGPPAVASRSVARPSPLDAADALLYVAKRAGRNAVAYREEGGIRLAGPAAGRRGLPAAVRSVFLRT